MPVTLYVAVALFSGEIEATVVMLLDAPELETVGAESQPSVRTATSPTMVSNLFI